MKANLEAQLKPTTAETRIHRILKFYKSILPIMKHAGDLRSRSCNNILDHALKLVKALEVSIGDFSLISSNDRGGGHHTTRQVIQSKFQAVKVS